MTMFSPGAGISDRRRWWPPTEKHLTIVLFLSPPLVIYTWLVILPIFQALFFSLYNWNGLGPLVNFVGMRNYVRLWNDSVFRSAIGHNLQIAAIAVFIQIPIVLGLALLLRSQFFGRSLFRIVFFLPFILSEVIAGLVWRFLYQPQGLVNIVVGTIVPGYEPVLWLSDRNTALIAVSVAVIWKYFGIYLILLIAGLGEIPNSIEEAARVEGASFWQQFRYVTFPMLRRTIAMCAFLTTLGAIQIFDLVWAMTQGGPVGATETMGTQLYKTAIRSYQIGYGSAMATVLFLLCLTFSIFYTRLLRHDD